MGNSEVDDAVELSPKQSNVAGDATAQPHSHQCTIASSLAETKASSDTHGTVSLRRERKTVVFTGYNRVRYLGSHWVLSLPLLIALNLGPAISGSFGGSLQAWLERRIVMRLWNV